MKLASYTDLSSPTGSGYGIVEGDALRPASAALRTACPTLGAAIGKGALAALAADCATTEPLPLDRLSLLPPIPDPGKVICVGINYPKRYPLDGSIVLPEHIILFAKLPGTLVGHGAPLELPPGDAAASFDYEGEIAAVIGRGGRAIPASEALAHVAGYTAFNDGSVREWQKHSIHAGKNFAGSGACGPWLVTADEIADPAAMTLVTRLNGEVVQSAGAADMVFPLAEVIAYVSATIPLAPGDVIATGSPEGSGASRTPPRFLRPGDLVEVEVSGVGTLANRVAACGATHR